MSKCRVCNLEIIDDTQKCPFCQCVLEKAPGGGKTYPNARVATRRFRLLSDIVLFVSIVTASCGIYINHMWNPHFWWSAILVLALVYVNVVLRLTIVGKSNYQIKIIGLVCFTVAIFTGMDFVTGYRGWSVNYVIPIAILLLDAALLGLIVINRRNWQSYIVPQLVMVIISGGAVALIANHIITEPLLTIIANAVSVFCFLGSVILGDRRARTELKRRFHP